jgi:murein DD-endopeptidase MepM/ murein hydrolase activator NlpD
MTFKSILLFFLVTLIAGCATAPVVSPPLPQVFKEVGVYHRVSPGETLWRISQIYGVDLDDIVKANRIPDAAIIEKGQLLFIPGASARKKEITSVQAAESSFIWPVKGKIVSRFGAVENNRVNKGIDIQTGAENISASSAGRVTFCDYLKGYGEAIIIEHSRGISTVYAGDLLTLVKLDDRVSAGNLIAKRAAGSGNTLLHFEVRRGYRSQNPLYYLP